MLNKAIVQLLEEVLARFGEEDRKIAREEPEACLVSMLTLIKRRLPAPSADLRMAIELTAYDKYLEEARKKLWQAEAEVKVKS